MKLKGTDIKIEKYGESKKPYVLPNVMDVFDWSVPFLTENITAVLKIILGGNDNKLTKNENKKFNQNVLESRSTDFDFHKQIQLKVRFLGRVSNLFKKIRRNGLDVGNERSKNITPEKGIVLDEDQTKTNQFIEIIHSDRFNEGLPNNLR